MPHPLQTQKNLWNSTSPTNASKTCKRAKPRLGGIFDYPLKAERLEEVERELERPSIWDNPEEATKLGQERASLAGVVHGLDEIRQGLQDAFDLIELAENDEATRQHWLQQTADMVDKYVPTHS